MIVLETLFVIILKGAYVLSLILETTADVSIYCIIYTHIFHYKIL